MKLRTTIRASRLSRPALVLRIIWFLLGLGCTSTASAQENKVWEYSPYQVQLWVQFDASCAETSTFHSRFMDQLVIELERTFRASWQIRANKLPRHLSNAVLSKLDSMSLTDLQRCELSLVVLNDHDETRSVRTIDSAADILTSIAVSPTTASTLTKAAADWSDSLDETSKRLLSKLSIQMTDDTAVAQNVADKQSAAAFLPTMLAQEIKTSRMITTALPWQLDHHLKLHDKIFFISVQMQGDNYRVAVRELDCPMLHFGPMVKGTSHSPSQLPRLASCLIQQSFAPVARVESATQAVAELRHKAGALIMDHFPDHQHNPARIRVGDVLYPIVRRDDRNGNPTLMQELKFTYCAVVESDGIQMVSNIYGFSGGPGLQGRQNRRTHRVLLRVRPVHSSSDLRVVVRGQSEKPQPGCFLYTKHFLTEQFQLQGRTDWRGQIAIPKPTEPIEVLPEAIRAERAAAKRKARQEAEAQAYRQYEEAVKKAEEAGEPAPKRVDPVNILAETIPIDPDTTIQLRQPLLQLFVKNGETVLAKLPFVPGVHPLEVAELTDDSLRLQAEAFVRGFQNDILDLVGTRYLLASRAKLLIRQGQLNKAKEVVEEMQTLRDFNQMNDRLVQIEKMILESSSSKIPRSSQLQIDRMFKSTRDMLQKHLQDDLVSAIADQLRNADSTSSTPES